MSSRLYMDVHVPYTITAGLRLRGVDVLTAQEDHCQELEDAALLDRATTMNRILLTQDDDLIEKAWLVKDAVSTSRVSFTRINSAFR